MSGLRGEETIAALCRREGIAEGLYYSWSKEFLEAGKKRLAGDTGRQATSGEVNSPLKKALLTGFHSTAKHNATKAVSPSSETMRTI